MPRIIFKCPHIKGGTKQAAKHLGHLVRYVATREGVELITHRENYTNYIAQRVGSHGLFISGDEPLALSRVMDEVAKHPGTVWLPIISLRREDAERLGYNNAESWQTLLTARAPELAKAMKIPLDQFRWYAAFHDKDDHPHVHMVCYSADGRSGFLTERGIEQIKSGLAKEIFRQDLTEIYQQQTQRRDELTAQSRETLQQLVTEMKNGALDNAHLEQLMNDLAVRLKTTKGKKQYGYLSASLKSLVDEIVDELAKDPCVAEGYDLWYQLREDVLRTYKNDLPERLPLSKQKEFRQVKNIIVQEAARMGQSPLTSAAYTAAPVHFEYSTRKQVIPSAARLLRQVGGLFQERTPQRSDNIRFVDSKLRRKIQEKKIAMGHKADDHEDYQQFK